MKKYHNLFWNIIKSIGILAGFFVLCLVIERYFEASTLVPAIMTLAVFLVSLVTDGFQNKL